MKLVKEIFTLCKCFPIQDSLALQDQLKRCSISIPSNIAEGASKISSIKFARYIRISLGSSFELETQILIAEELYPNLRTTEILSRLKDIQKQLNGFHKQLRMADDCATISMEYMAEKAH